MKMKKLSKEEALLDSIINQLREVKYHFVNERPFEGGVGMGVLMNDLGNRIEKLRGQDEEVHDEESDEECEEDYEEEDFDWEFTKDIIKDLIKNDHIFPGKIDSVIKKLAQCDGENEESLYAIQSGTTIKMKE
jgi:hypothetical protein